MSIFNLNIVIIPAYIDPGTGSLLAAALISLIMTVLFTLKGIFYKFIHYSKGSSGGPDGNFENRLVFYSEGKNYWNVFQPVLDGIASAGEQAVYLTSDKKDPGLNYNSELIETHYIGSIKYSITFLNRLKADTVVMTTPQLGVMHLKRSPYVRHYIHLMHAPTDIHTYEKFAFDDFDTVLCSGPFQIENIRFLEQKRGMPAKFLAETGCVYYDTMPELDGNSPSGTVLIAPTWGEKSFMKRCGSRVIREVLNAGFKVIFRPHPQSFISDKILIDNIIEQFKENGDFRLDNSVSNIEAIRESDYLIADISGIIYDYVFLRKKPVFAFDIPWRKGGYEASDLLNRQAEFSIVEEAGTLLHPDTLQTLTEMLKTNKAISVPDAIVSRYIFNFGKAGRIAAEQIMSIHKQTSALSQ